jgi:hypothetical protein
MVNYMQKVNECIHLLSACNYHDGLDWEGRVEGRLEVGKEERERESKKSEEKRKMKLKVREQGFTFW